MSSSALSVPARLRPRNTCPILVGLAMVAAVASGCSKDKKESAPAAAEPPADYGQCESVLPGEPIDLSNEKLVEELVKKDGRGGAVATLEQMLKRCSAARVPGVQSGTTVRVVILDAEVKSADGKALMPFKFNEFNHIPSATQTVSFEATAEAVGKDKAITLIIRGRRLDG